MRDLRRWLADHEHWREAAIAGGVTLVLLWAASAAHGVTRLALCLAAVIAGTVAWMAVQRARRPHGGQGPGVVKIRERRIAYMGPEEGGTLSFDRMEEVAVDGRVWHLADTDGNRLAIPADALGAGAIFDALSPLPGLDEGTLSAALNDPAPGRRVIWRRTRDALPRR